MKEETLIKMIKNIGFTFAYIIMFLMPLLGGVLLAGGVREYYDKKIENRPITLGILSFLLFIFQSLISMILFCEVWGY